MKFSFSCIYILLIIFSPNLYAITETITIQIRWHHQFQSAGYYAAIKKGYFKEEGLHVKIQEADINHNPIDEVLKKHALYGVGNSEVLLHRLKGEKLILISSIFQHSASILLVKADSNINSPHDLLGKKVMLMNNFQDPALIAMFLNEGMNLNDINIVPSSYNVDDLVTNKVDAFNAYITNEPFYLSEKNIPYKIIKQSDYNIDFYSDLFFTNEEELINHPKRVESMKKAITKGWEYAMNNQEEIITFILKNYNADKSREHLQYEAREMEKLILPNVIEIGHINPNRIEKMADTFLQVGIIDTKEHLEGFIYDPNQNKIPYKVILFVLLSMLLIVLLVLLWNLVLRKKVKMQVAKNLAQSEIIHQKNKTEQIGEMVANISHQWREPLSNLSAINLLNLAKIEKKHQINLTDFKAQCIDIEKNINFMSETMQSFLEFYKISDIPTNFDLRQSVIDILTITQTSILDNNVTIVIPESPNVELEGIRNDWMNVWLNLIQNSIKVANKRDIASLTIKIIITTDSICFCDNAGGLHNIENQTNYGLGLKMCNEIVSKYDKKLELINKDEGLCIKISF